MQRLWINGEQVELSPREELRLALRAGESMNDAERNYRRSLMSAGAFNRFERLYIWGTATEHPRTRGVTLQRWSSRRERIRRAVRTLREAA